MSIERARLYLVGGAQLVRTLRALERAKLAAKQLNDEHKSRVKVKHGVHQPLFGMLCYSTATWILWVADERVIVLFFPGRSGTNSASPSLCKTSLPCQCLL